MSTDVHHRWRLAVCRAGRLATLLLPLGMVACSSVPLSSVSQATSPGPSSAGAAASAPSSLPALPPAGSGRGGYYLDDGPGDAPPDGLAAIPDAEPRVERYFKRGNQPYVVFGKSYTPFTDDRPYKKRGIASWYGKKFHGQRTSSGELYDMYKMTAAHPTLPLPSYVRVTNLANGKQVIVRVNDRGPFHASRIIDLSYTAALKLGYLSAGRAEVEVERLLPEEIERMASAREKTKSQLVTAAQPMTVASPASPARISAAPGFYLQLGAYSEAANAEAARATLAQGAAMTLPPLQVVEAASLHRLYSGPFATREAAELAARRLEKTVTFSPVIVQR